MVDGSTSGRVRLVMHYVVLSNLIDLIDAEWQNPIEVAEYDRAKVR